MKILWSWLKDYVDLAQTTTDEISKRLTLVGLEVEEIEHLGEKIKGIRTALIETIEPHPNADKLSLVRVICGSDSQTVVCGAKNMKVGDVVALATAGLTLPNGLTLKKTKIRGVISAGMLLSEVELEIGNDDSGLMILPSRTPHGQPLSKILQLDDVVIDFGITPNRPDCLSHIGVAREAAAILSTPLKLPLGLDGKNIRYDNTKVTDLVSIELEDQVGCPRYVGAVVRGLRVGPSPSWLKNRVEAIGTRSVNNLVDISNYVLFETGQPLHFFDLDKLANSQLLIRRARDGEPFEGINHVSYKLVADDVVICDANGPVAVAGVMGGAHSEVSDETTSIVIECAHFDPGLVRKTSKRLALHTESSHRFERGVDPDNVGSVYRAITLILRCMEEQGVNPLVAQGLFDLYPTPVVRPPVILRPQRVEHILGISVSVEEITKFLESIDLDVKLVDGTLVITPPTFRFDLEREIDIIEEIARLYGYDRIPSSLPFGGMGYVHQPLSLKERKQPIQPLVSNETLVRLSALRTRMADCGLLEAINYTFGDPQIEEKLGLSDDGQRRLINPLSEDLSVMRKSLLTGLLTNIKHNQDHGSKGVGLFEIGKVYSFEKGSEPSEESNLAIVLAGQKFHHWSDPGQPYDLFELKGLLLEAISNLGFEAQIRPTVDRNYLHPYSAGTVWVRGKLVGRLGRLHPDVERGMELSAPVFAAEIELFKLLAIQSKYTQFKEILKSPEIRHDFSVTVKTSTSFMAIDKAINGFRHKWIKGYELFDLYRGEHVEAGYMSLAISMVYQSKDRNLTHEEVSKIHKTFVDHFCKKVGAKRR